MSLPGSVKALCDAAFLYEFLFHAADELVHQKVGLVYEANKRIGGGFCGLLFDVGACRESRIRGNLTSRSDRTDRLDWTR